MTPLDLTYPNVLRLLRRHLARGRTESRAFLAWFLENYYRLEDVAAHDAVCDGPDDKGIDGLYVDENLERIDILQSKLFQNTTKTLGDGALKSLLGTVAQLQTPEGVENIIATTSNHELASLLKEKDVPHLVQRGFTVRGVLVTNTSRDANADSFLAGQPSLVLYDANELQASYIPTGPSAPVATPVTFDLSGFDAIEYKTENARAIFAPLLASELVRMDGLQSGRLFNWNVRQSLGKTKVNKEIAASVLDPAEHKNFLLYHNGLTILCEAIESNETQLTIRGYNVVNGCQSLTSLYENRSAISSDLRVLVRLVELSPESELAAKITHHSNNQNAINARDLQSNSSIQRRLQNEFSTHYRGEVAYKIKRGEDPSEPVVLENEDVARILLAFDLEQPWSCHQTYKLFDELHGEIFARPEVNAHRILALFYVFGEVEYALTGLTHELMARYTLTKYFVLYLLKEVLKQDEQGAEFIRRPETFLQARDGVSRLRSAVRHILDDLIVDLNAEIKEREDRGEPIDYKRELKSVASVKKLAKDIIPAYQKAVKRQRAASFAQEWADSEETTAIPATPIAPQARDAPGA